MHAISSHRGNKLTNTQTDRGDYNTLRRSLARSVITDHVVRSTYKQAVCALIVEYRSTTAAAERRSRSAKKIAVQRLHNLVSTQ